MARISTTRIAPLSCHEGMEDQKGPLALLKGLANHERKKLGKELGLLLRNTTTTPKVMYIPSDEDEPVLSEGDLEEDNLIEITKVLNDTTVGVGIHGGDSDPGTDSEDNTKDDGHAPELRKVPLDRRLGVGSVVVGNGKSGDVGEDGNEDNELNVQAAVQDGNPETKVNLEMDGQGDTVDDVGVHAVENLAGSLEGIDDGAETRGKEDDIGSGAGSVGGTLDGNTSIGLLERGSIVDTVTSHGNEVATLLENLDDVVLVLGENLGETIGSLNEIVNLRAGHVTTTTETETLSVVDVGAETELTRSLASDTDGITSKHLDGQTERLGLVDSAGGIVARGVRAGHDTKDLPVGVFTLASNTEGTETTGGELSDLVLVGGIDILGDNVVLLDSLQDEKRGTLDTDDTLALGGLNNGLNLLGDGIEGLEVEDTVLAKHRLGARVESQTLEESLVDSIHTLLLAGSGQAGSEHEILGVDTLDGVGLGKGELVLGEGTGLVRAENLDTSKGLDSGELLNDGLLLGEVGSTDSHGGGDDSGETDGHTNDGNGKSELENLDDAVGAVERGNPDNQVGQDNQKEQDGTNAVEDLSEVTRAGASSVDKGSSATDEGVVTSGGNDNEGLTTLDGGGSVAGVVLVLVDGERLTGDGGLINLEESIIGDDTAISGNDGTLLNLENITGDNLGSLDLLQGAVTENDSLEGKSLLEFIDDRTSLVFLDETDNSVQKQQTRIKLASGSHHASMEVNVPENDTEINPVFETSSHYSQKLASQNREFEWRR